MRVSRNSEAAYHALNVASNVIISSIVFSFFFSFYLTWLLHIGYYLPTFYSFGEYWQVWLQSYSDPSAVR